MNLNDKPTDVIIKKLKESNVQAILDENQSSFSEECILITLQGENGEERFPIRVKSDGNTIYIEDSSAGVFNGLTLHNVRSLQQPRTSDKPELSDDDKLILNNARINMESNGGSPYPAVVEADSEELDAISKGISPIEYRASIAKQRDDEQKKAEKQAQEADFYDQLADRLMPNGNAPGAYKKPSFPER